MRADICGPDDEAAIERFRNALRRLGARLGDKGWAMGCDIYRLKIEGEELIVFSDTWSIDIEGRDDLVQDYQETGQASTLIVSGDSPLLRRCKVEA